MAYHPHANGYRLMFLKALKRMATREPISQELELGELQEEHI